MSREKIKRTRQEAIENASRELAIELNVGGDRFNREDFGWFLLGEGLDTDDLQAIRERSLALAKDGHPNGHEPDTVQFFLDELDYWLDKRAFEMAKEGFRKMSEKTRREETRHRVTEPEFSRFEEDLLNVLKKDKDHGISFDGKLIFKSSRYNCDLRAIDVHWDEKKGDLVLVGAVKDEVARMGGNIRNEKGEPVFKNTIEVSFREVYEDMKHQREARFNESYLISKTRKSVIDKYITHRLERLERLDLTGGGVLSFKDFNIKDVKTSGHIVSGILIGEDGRVNLRDHNGGSVSLLDFSLSDIQDFGDNMGSIVNMYDQAFVTYTEGRQKYLKEGHQYDTFLDNLGTSEGLACIYEKGYPNRICNAIARRHSGCDLFDTAIYNNKEIHDRVHRYRASGVLIQNTTYERRTKTGEKPAAIHKTKHKTGMSI